MIDIRLIQKAAQEYLAMRFENVEFTVEIADREVGQYIIVSWWNGPFAQTVFDELALMREYVQIFVARSAVLIPWKPRRRSGIASPFNHIKFDWEQIWKEFENK